MNTPSMLRVLLLVSLTLFAPASEAADHPNVLLIAVDDLNDWVGCLGGHPNAVSPNIDRLAQRGTLFTNAHCQAPICNPSRTSIMYGLRPSNTGIYMNSPQPWKVAAMQDHVSLPRHFAANGYVTYTTGKIYHGSGLPDGDFDIVGPRPGQRIKLDQRLVPPTPGGAKGLWDFGAQTYDETKFQDYADATWAIEALEKHSPTDQPFLVAVGFYRPHVPLYAPKRLLDAVASEDIALPPHREDDRADIPSVAWDVAVSAAAPPHSWFVESDQWLDAVRAYHACVRWTDEQVGRLLTALDRSPHAENTIVVLYSDHGFFLGEKQRWAKQSLWERATRVPFVIAGPGVTPGQRCVRPVELLSIYPTLIDLCRLTPRTDLDGVSVQPLLKDASSEWDRIALTTHGLNNHAVRDDRYRYIRYHDGSEELYDINGDPNEWTNEANNPELADIKASLKNRLPESNAEPAKAPPKKTKRTRKVR